MRTLSQAKKLFKPPRLTDLRLGIYFFESTTDNIPPTQRLQNKDDFSVGHIGLSLFADTWKLEDIDNRLPWSLTTDDEQYVQSIVMS